ncbi:hypothetical protein CJ030_MR5G024504 [Morella rubra]|uniref:VQ domain-containing protein n=1 Tax=Morella rubra TaxID=262757 RepID=A0A6A1UFY3_9ROSI|nr:hypothetical protein CJ030_MR0G027046 [Morella rubra]KAB1214928.1 hypothetical protein CJ030_MR5G024504 [Morella rubra]
MTMKAYSSYSSSSSSSTTNKNSLLHHPPNSSLLHTVRKSAAKPWKKPVAPLPPTPSRVYKVDPVNFRDLVQKLTGATELGQSRRLRSAAPPPLNVAAELHPCSTAKKPLSALYHQDLISGAVLQMKQEKASESNESPFFLELNLSPSSHGWFSFPLLSPGSLSSMEQSTVL